MLYAEAGLREAMAGDAIQIVAEPKREILDPRTIGILTFVTALVFASMHSGLSKWLTEDLSVPLIIWWRYLGLFLIVVPVALAHHGRTAVVPARPWLHVLRGLLIIVASFSFLGAISKISPALTPCTAAHS